MNVAGPLFVISCNVASCPQLVACDIILPSRSSRDGPREVSITLANVGDLNMERALVVDDDETIRDTLYELLSEEYICQTAETAEKAMARLQADTYDVVLTDISMPGLSGLELLGQVRQRFPHTPVIVISGISDQEHAQGLIKLGAFDYLLKPFTLDDVEKSVRRAVDYRKRLIEESEREKFIEDDDEPVDWKIIE